MFLLLSVIDKSASPYLAILYLRNNEIQNTYHINSRKILPYFIPSFEGIFFFPIINQVFGSIYQILTVPSFIRTLLRIYACTSKVLDRVILLVSWISASLNTTRYNRGANSSLWNLSCNNCDPFEHDLISNGNHRNHFFYCSRGFTLRRNAFPKTLSGLYLAMHGSR